MYRHVFGALLVLQVLVLPAQFEQEHAIAQLETIGDILTGDVDEDGTTDVVSCGYEGAILLYRGAGGGAFQPPETIGMHRETRLYSSALLDVDGDGDLDVLYHDHAEAMRMLRNDGAGNFAAPVVLFPLLHDVSNGIHFGDLDGDADVDIVFSRMVGNSYQIVRYINDGSGVFTFGGVIGSSTDSGFWIKLADLDGDGDMDVFSSQYSDNRIVRYANNGNGTFAAPTLMWSGAQHYMDKVRTADLNMDGIEDICFSDGERTVRLMLSTSGGFQPSSVLYDGPGPYLNCDIQLADMDANGTTDVVCGAASALIGFFPNPGDAAFPAAPDTLVRYPWANILDRFVTGDMDNNGLLDIVGIGSYTLIYYADQGVGSEMRLPQAISREMLLSLMADIDQDGDLDALAMHTFLYDISHGFLMAAYNDGTGNFSRPDTLSPQGLVRGFEADRPFSQLHDMDDDGDLDYLFLNTLALEYRLNWLVNNGNGYFDSLVVIENVRSYALADLDQDGEEDLAMVRNLDGWRIGWSRGLGAGQFGPFIEIRSVFGIYDLATADVDNDGDMDLTAVGVGGGLGVPGMTFENLGAGEFDTHLHASTTDVSHLWMLDMDGDGLRDLVLNYSYVVRWSRNLGGFQFQLPYNTISTASIGAPALVDADGDGDIDVVSNGIYDRWIEWSQNLGAGVFAPSAELVALHVRLRTVIPADVDGDGILDLAYSCDPDSTSGPFAYNPGWVGGTGLNVGLSSVADLGSASIYPAPFIHEATIQLAQPLASNERLCVIDASGRTVREIPGTGSERITLTRGDLVGGVYILQVKRPQGTLLVGRVVVE